MSEKNELFFKIKALTLRECFDRGIIRVYDPNWIEKDSYIKLPKKIKDNYPPMAYLFSEETQELLKIETPQTVPLFYLNAGLDSICLEYKGKLSKFDKD